MQIQAFLLALLLVLRTAAAFTIDDQPREAMIHLHARADLDALTLPESMTRAERRNAVHHYLSAHAEREQRGVRTVLAKHDVAHEAFWIANAVHAHNLTAAAAEELGALRACTVTAVGGVRRIAPVPKRTAYALQGRALEEGDGNGDRNVASGGVQPNIKKVKADQCWSAENATGQGVTVATLDGGVNYRHEALVGSYRGTQAGGKSFVHDYNWADFAYQNAEPSDTDDGHGSNVAGVLAGSEASGSPAEALPWSRRQL